MTLTRILARSAGLYPITGVYLAGVGVICLYAAGRVSLAASIIIFGVATVIAICWAASREIRTVHAEIVAQRTRIDELTDLVAADLRGEQDRADTREHQPTLEPTRG